MATSNRGQSLANSQVTSVPLVRGHRPTLPLLCFGVPAPTLTDWLCVGTFARRDYVRAYALSQPFFCHSHFPAAKPGSLEKSHAAPSCEVAST